LFKSFCLFFCYFIFFIFIFFYVSSFLFCHTFACIFNVSLQRKLCGLYFYYISTCALVSRSFMILFAAHFPRHCSVLFIGDLGSNKVRALDLPTSMVALSAVASCCRVNDATTIVCGGVVVCFSARVFRFPPMLAAVLIYPATAHLVRPFATRFLQLVSLIVPLAQRLQA
jgi:hypothetical protein